MVKVAISQLNARRSILTKSVMAPAIRAITIAVPRSGWRTIRVNGTTVRKKWNAQIAAA